MNLAVVIKNGKNFKKGSVYIVDQAMANLLKRTNVATIYPITVFEKYQGKGKLLVLRTGGLGDIIALSSVLDENSTLLTHPKHIPVIDYFEHKPIVKDMSKPIWDLKDIQLFDIVNDYKMVWGDEAIDQGSKENWYNIFEKATNRPSQGRPRLIEPTDPIEKGYCLIVSKSSNANRNADTNTLIEIANNYYSKVLVATEQKWTTKEYLNQLCMAEMVISTDTSAIHFREGIKRKALGLYGAFTTEARTKYYQHTKSIDIQSLCDKQPCFSHIKNNCKHLVNMNAGCLSPEFNPTLKAQVSEALKTYIGSEANSIPTRNYDGC